MGGQDFMAGHPQPGAGEAAAPEHYNAENPDNNQEDQPAIDDQQAPERIAAARLEK